jgi:hypothetical protein
MATVNRRFEAQTLIGALAALKITDPGLNTSWHTAIGVVSGWAAQHPGVLPQATLPVDLPDSAAIPNPVGDLTNRIEALFGSGGPIRHLQDGLARVEADLQSMEATKDKINELLAIVTGFLESTKRLAPSMPAGVLQDVALGITQVEQALNPENLVISSGRVVVSMTVGSKDVAQADTTFTFDIQPKPIS